MVKLLRQLSTENLQGDRSSYEKLFPFPFLTAGNTVDMLDQSWRRAARDYWPTLFKHYNIIVTARFALHTSAFRVVHLYGKDVFGLV